MPDHLDCTVELVRWPARRGAHRGRHGQHPVLILLPRLHDMGGDSAPHGCRRRAWARGRSAIYRSCNVMARRFVLVTILWTAFLDQDGCTLLLLHESHILHRVCYSKLFRKTLHVLDKFHTPLAASNP